MGFRVRLGYAEQSAKRSMGNSDVCLLCEFYVDVRANSERIVRAGCWRNLDGRNAFGERVVYEHGTPGTNELCISFSDYFFFEFN